MGWADPLSGRLNGYSTLCPPEYGGLYIASNLEAWKLYMPFLQRLCVLRRSVVGLAHVSFGSFSRALIGPSPMMIDNCRRHIITRRHVTRPLKN